MKLIHNKLKLKQVEYYGHKLFVPASTMWLTLRPSGVIGAYRHCPKWDDETKWWWEGDHLADVGMMEFPEGIDFMKTAHFVDGTSKDAVWLRLNKPAKWTTFL